MATIGLTEYANMFKILFPDGEVENAALHEMVWAKRVKKMDDFTGREMDWPLPFANGAGRSHVYATAQANASAPQYAGWKATRKRDYVVWEVDCETLNASRDDNGAFAAAQEYTAKQHLSEIGRSFSVGLYGRVGGGVGTIAVGGISGSTATLTFAHDARNFFKGQKIDVSATNDSAAAARGGGPLTVASVSYSAGTVTFTAGIVATVAAAVVGDTLIPNGDAGLAMSGLQEWIPITAPSATPFNNVDRTQDIERLSGFRVNNPNADPGENLITLGELVSIGKPGPKQIILCNPIHYGGMLKSLSSKIVYQRQGSNDNQGKMLIGGTGVMVGLSSGVAEIVVDPDCPGGFGWLLDEDTWEFHSLNAVPHIAMEDGNKSRMIVGSDAIRIFARWWGEQTCKNPHKNGVFSTPV